MTVAIKPTNETRGRLLRGPVNHVLGHRFPGSIGGIAHHTPCSQPLEFMAPHESGHFPPSQESSGTVGSFSWERWAGGGRCVGGRPAAALGPYAQARLPLLSGPSRRQWLALNRHWVSGRGPSPPPPPPGSVCVPRGVPGARGTGARGTAVGRVAEVQRLPLPPGAASPACAARVGVRVGTREQPVSGWWGSGLLLPPHLGTGEASPCMSHVQGHESSRT